MSETNTAALVAPYTRKIGKVTFLISSFGNPDGTKTSAEMLVQMMERQLKDRYNDKKESA